MSNGTSRRTPVVHGGEYVRDSIEILSVMIDEAKFKFTAAFYIRTRSKKCVQCTDRVQGDKVAGFSRVRGTIFGS